MAFYWWNGLASWRRITNQCSDSWNQHNTMTVLEVNSFSSNSFRDKSNPPSINKTPIPKDVLGSIWTPPCVYVHVCKVTILWNHNLGHCFWLGLFIKWVIMYLICANVCPSYPVLWTVHLYTLAGPQGQCCWYLMYIEGWPPSLSGLICFEFIPFHHQPQCYKSKLMCEMMLPHWQKLILKFRLNIDAWKILSHRREGTERDPRSNLHPAIY